MRRITPNSVELQPKSSKPQNNARHCTTAKRMVEKVHLGPFYTHLYQIRCQFTHDLYMNSVGYEPFVSVAPMFIEYILVLHFLLLSDQCVVSIKRTIISKWQQSPGQMRLRGKLPHQLKVQGCRTAVTSLYVRDISSNAPIGFERNIMFWTANL